MKHNTIAIITATAVIISAVILRQNAHAQNTTAQLGREASVATAEAVRTETNGRSDSPIFVTEMPPGYRDWKLISVAHEEGSLNDIRAILGNDIAVEAYREGKLPFPDGSVIARIAWSYVASEENNKVFGRHQSFVAGPPTNGVQFMVKDSTKYAATGGWGYGHFDNGKSAERATLKTCFACHDGFKDRDFVFTRYAP
jgi:hypothetical protein